MLARMTIFTAILTGISVGSTWLFGKAVEIFAPTQVGTTGTNIMQIICTLMITGGMGYMLSMLLFSKE